jgi:hypothetical protein
MRHFLASAALAATFAFAGAAAAQAPPASKPTAPTTGAPSSAAPSDATPSAAPPATPSSPSAGAPPPSASASGTNSSANAGAGASLTTGMSVKDNTGALIGEVKQLKGGLATIQMGNDSFTVDASKLGVSGGAATINATQAELKQMIAGARK